MDSFFSRGIEFSSLVLALLLSFSSASAMEVVESEGMMHCATIGETSVLAIEGEPSDKTKVTLRAMVANGDWSSPVDCRISDDSLVCPALGSARLYPHESESGHFVASVVLSELDAIPTAVICTPTAPEPEPEAMYKSWGIWYESANDDQDCDQMCRDRGFASGYCDGVSDFSNFIGLEMGPTLHCNCVTPAGNEHDVDMQDPDPGLP